MKADLFQDKKTRKRKEDVTTDERLEDISFVRVYDDPISQTSFGKSAEPSEAPEKIIGDALVDGDVKAPKPRLSRVKMRKSAPAGGLLHTGPASTYKTLGTNFPPQPLLWSFGKTIGKRDVRTTARQTFDMYNRSWHLKVIKMKSRRSLVADQV